MGIFQWANQVLVLPVRRNLTATLFVVGLVLIALGTFDMGFHPTLAEIFSKLGGATLGAGVFAVIMKSAQFTELFQQHIADVIYHPHRVENADFLLEKWRLLTESLLRGVLPSTYSTAGMAIEKRYFDRELDYHFDGFEQTYTIDCNAGMFTVTSTLRTTLVISPGKQNPCFEQKVRSDNGATLTSLILDDRTVALGNGLLSGEGEEKVLKFNLEEYAKGKGTVKLERTFRTVQSSDEPFIAVTISRFIKGAVVRAKISPVYMLRFLSMGIEGYEEGQMPDGNGYTRWTLAAPDGLLLPGQGYTLIFVRKH